jgi:competence protein ComEA
MNGRLVSNRWSRVLAGVAMVVLASGLAVAAESKPAASPAPKPKAEASAHPSSAKIDINSATKEELSKLPGIGDAYSQKIIDGRPYKSKSELESKKILPKSVYDKIAPHIIAHQK